MRFNVPAAATGHFNKDWWCLLQCQTGTSLKGDNYPRDAAEIPAGKELAPTSPPFPLSVLARRFRSDPNKIMKNAIVVLILLVAAFAAGYLPKYFELSSVRQESQSERQRLDEILGSTRQELRLALLQGRLAMILVEAERSNFGTAREHSTAFFDALNETIVAESNNARRTSLSAIAQNRDQVTAGLAASDATVAQTLRDLFLRLSADAKVGWPTARPGSTNVAQ